MNDQNPQIDLEPNKAKFSWKRVSKIILGILAAVLILAGGYFLTTYRPARIKWASLTRDNHEHYLPCYDLPFYQQADKALSSNTSTVEAIKKAGGFLVTAQEVKCYNADNTMYFRKGDILIQYSSHEQRIAIEKIVGPTFFGIPYRGENH